MPYATPARQSIYCESWEKEEETNWSFDPESNKHELWLSAIISIIPA